MFLKANVINIAVEQNILLKISSEFWQHVIFFSVNHICWSFNGPEPGGLELMIRKREKEADSTCWSFNGPEPGGSKSKREKEADIPWFTRKADRVLVLGLRCCT